MAINDDIDRALNEENPGPSELESRLVHDTMADVISHPPLITKPETSLADALRLMREHRHGYILLVAGERLAGIFTERDILMKVAGSKIDLARTPVSDYMTAELVTLPSDAVVAFALNRMVVEGFRHIPVLDGLGQPVGVVSMRDIIDYLSESYQSDLLNLPPEPSRVLRKRDGA